MTYSEERAKLIELRAKLDKAKVGYDMLVARNVANLSTESRVDLDIACQVAWAEYSRLDWEYRKARDRAALEIRREIK